MGEEECCPDIDIKKYDLKVSKWSNKSFLAVNILHIFHIPLGMGAAVKYAMKTAEKAGIMPAQPMLLYGKEGLFWAKLFLEVQKQPSENKELSKQVVSLDGTFVSKAYQGSYSKLGTAVKELKEYVKQKYQKEPLEYYFWYANCPKCAKQQGGEKTVIFARIS